LDSNNRPLVVVSFTTFENELLRKAVFSSVQIHLDLGGASALEASKATLEEDGTSLCVPSSLRGPVPFELQFLAFRAVV
jgi:hypothetical protein